MSYNIHSKRRTVPLERISKILTAALVIMLPLLVNAWLSTKDRYYSCLVSKWECSYGCLIDMRNSDCSACKADFDGNSITGSLVRNYVTPDDDWLVVVDSGRELLRIPYNQADEVIRTHIAIRKEQNAARVLVFDSTRQRGAVTNAVYVYDGQKMTQVTADDADQEVLSAMAARDLAGTAYLWMLFDFLARPLIFAYYMLLFIALMIWRKRSR